MTLGRAVDGASSIQGCCCDEKDLLLLDPVCMVLTDVVKPLHHPEKQPSCILSGKV